MPDSEQPQETDKSVYQRDKTAKEPVKTEPDSEIKPKPKPKPKPRKAFVPKKLVKVIDKPQEYRVRQIRISSLEAAKIFYKTLIDFQKELAAEPIDDPDKPFHDQEKVEKYFIRIAKKYSICSTRVIGGDLDWIYKGMTIHEEIINQELIDVITQSEKHVIPEPVKTKLGFHIILICENRDRIEIQKQKAIVKPKTAPAGTNIPT
jgi:parvulin-like peptidyl-prolyl isomerase